MITSRRKLYAVYGLLFTALTLGACTTTPTDAGTRSTATSPPSVPSSTTQALYPPPVDYQPESPDRTRTTSHGYQVNTCVPAEHDRNALTLTASDGAHLSALELGSGGRGILLAHERGYNICSWLSLGEELAAAGYHVLLFEYREHGASEDVAKGNSIEDAHMVRDVRAALNAVHRRGANRVLMAGASCGGTSSAAVAADEPKLVGLLMLASPAQCGNMDAEAAVRTISEPSFFAVSTGDYSGQMLDEVKILHRASASTNKHLEIIQGGKHGTSMLRDDDDDAKRLHRLIRGFIDAAFQQ